jgi:hypothetical protein
LAVLFLLDIVTINFANNVANVDSHMKCRSLFSLFLDTCMLMDSDRPSAIAIEDIPPMTANSECVPELNLAMRPDVVKTKSTLERLFHLI